MMKKLVICLALMLPLAGCSQAGGMPAGKLLPAEIDNIMDDDVVIDGPEERAFDPEAYDGRMFVGTWLIKETDGDMPVLEVPAPSGSEQQTWQVEAFPAQMIFCDAVRGEEETYRINFDDFYYMQAVFNRCPGEAEKETPEPAGFRMLFDVYDKTLAFGFTGEVTDELYFTEDVDHVHIQEEDYGFDWDGYALTLRYGGAKATYYPSTFQEDMQSACEGFSGSNGQTKMPGWQFSPLVMNGDGSGTIGTCYGTGIPMTYSFGEDGSFSVTAESGETFTYDKYWYSDSCLTLPDGDRKMMYQHDLLSFYTDDPYRTRNISAGLWADELTMSGKDMQTPLAVSVSQLISMGFKTDVDTGGSMIPSGCVSPEFDLTFRTSHLHVQAVNPTDIPLPLDACIVCRYAFDETCGSIIRHMSTFFDSIPVTCGETTRKDLEMFGNLYPVDDSHLAVQMTIYAGLYDTDFADYSARLLDGVEDMNTTVCLQLEMEGDVLKGIDCFIPEYENLNADGAETASASEDTVYSEWSDLFLYGKAELSEDGRARLDAIADQYAAMLKKHDQITGIEIGVYARIDRTDEGQSFTVPRAEAVAEYFRDALEAKAVKCPVDAVGYGETEYLLDDDAVYEMSGNIVAFRPLLKADQEAAANEPVTELIYKETEGEATYSFMKPDESLVGKARAAFAAKYSGSYTGDTYVNEAIGMTFKLPEGWHFYNDTELGAYNGSTAEKLLLKGLPIYIFAAVNDAYDTMIDVRLYPCDTQAFEGAGEAFSDNLLRSYESVCRTDYNDVSVQTEDVKFGEKTVKKAAFTFSADEQSFVRKIYYVICDDAIALVSLSGTQDGAVLDDPGLH